MMAVRQRQWRSSLLFVCFLTFCLFSAVFLADELSIAVTSGMQLAIGTIIPSLFPFMILADLAVCSMPSESGVIGKQFQKLLNLDSSTLSTFVIGNLSGAPVGAGMISSLRINGKISREEAERALAISSGPSLAFTVSGVGAAMWGKAYIGVILYLSVILSSVAYAIFTRGKHLARSSTPTSRKKFSLIRSIEDATLASLRVTGVVTAFTVVTHLLSRLKIARWVSNLIIPLVELGGAVSYLSKADLPTLEALILTAFALGFSGFSIHLQVRTAIANTDIKYSRFLLAKCLIGLMSATIFSLIYLFIK